MELRLERFAERAASTDMMQTLVNIPKIILRSVDILRNQCAQTPLPFVMWISSMWAYFWAPQYFCFQLFITGVSASNMLRSTVLFSTGLVV